MMILSVVSLVISLIALVISMKSYRLSQSVQCDLDEKYWTKDVVGRTITTKTGGDPYHPDGRIEKAAPKAVNFSNPEESEAYFKKMEEEEEIDKAIDEVLKGSEDVCKS